MANAAVTITNTSTNASQRVLTTPDGFFSVSGLPPGIYRVDVETAGLKRTLLLAAILAYGFRRTAAYLPLPLWSRKSIRPSILDLLNLLRDQIFARLMPGQMLPSIDHFVASPPADANAAKPPLGSETLCTVAA